MLGQHPNVSDTAVVAWEDASGNKKLAAYVVPNFQDQSDNFQESNSELQTEQLSEWKAVFDDLYEKYSPDQELKFNIEGWESSYTRTPMPPSEVAEWIDQTVERINSLNPSRVLELGCGSGLTLFRVAPHCTHYYATDLSTDALGVLQHQLDLVGQDLPVTPQQRGADNFDGIKPDSFDSLLVVSVLQYFPSFEYLLRVFEGAVNTVKPGGFIYLADVRSLPLLELFHSSVQLYQAPSNLPIEELQQRIEKQLLYEKQMVVDPAFFDALKQHLPKISHVEIKLQRGHYYNELTKFRYDVILHIRQKEVNPQPEILWLDWKDKDLTISSVLNLFLENQVDILGITRVPNARIYNDFKALQLLKNPPEGIETVGQIQEIINSISEGGVDPEEFWKLEEDLPLEVHITWSTSGENNCYDVILRKCDTDTSETCRKMLLSFPKQTLNSKNLSNYVHKPLNQKILHGLESKLRSFLEEKLPSYMVPSTFTTLNTLPLTPTGKLDRKALPADGELNRDNEYVAPLTPNEKIIANIFTEVLGIQNVGIYDNFFELGGHSLLAVRLMSEIQKHFHKNLPLATLFQSPTVAELVNVLEFSINTNNSTLVSIKPSGNKPPLFCIHPTGGNVLCYADLARYLNHDYPVYGLQSFGLDGKHQPLTKVEEMASHYLEAIQKIQPQGPLHLIGWSMGGIIAYEIAQQLQAENKQVALLTLIDSYAPTANTLPSEINQAIIISQLAQEWEGIYGQKLDISLKTLRKLQPDEQLKHLFEQAKQQAIFPPGVEIEQMISLWKVFQANITADYYYQAKPYSGSMLLLNASETPLELIEESTKGWKSLVSGEIETHTLIGNHYTLLQRPKVKLLAEKLNNYLEFIQN